MTFYGIFFFYIIFWTTVVSPTPILNRGYEPKTKIFDFTIGKKSHLKSLIEINRKSIKRIVTRKHMINNRLIANFNIIK